MEKVIDMVYLFGFSPRFGNELNRLVPILKSQIEKGKKISIVFIHDGVIGTSSKGKITESVNILRGLMLKKYVMTPDLAARGIPLEHIQEDLQPIDYMELVDIMENSNKIISWM
ncbi:MAG: sulfurtransferase complex subunit TusB [Candidatus Heimdallarchaeota archaeon]